MDGASNDSMDYRVVIVDTNLVILQVYVLKDHDEPVVPLNVDLTSRFGSVITVTSIPPFKKSMTGSDNTA